MLNDYNIWYILILMCAHTNCDVIIMLQFLYIYKGISNQINKIFFDTIEYEPVCMTYKLCLKWFVNIYDDEYRMSMINVYLAITSNKTWQKMLPGRVKLGVYGFFHI